ncbi:hypothetical protein PR003_g30477 [Phytophthora rubi]|uniref:Uncharacterized protein n=1 Tax=Phytophthora rubi TaxID=129364 RepID=A0A6A3HDX2_9STRA|nr:hypothetical protein PR001_g27865 [Phytophthora rubi]KAE9271545.1 hypothetical protein PR003_g30477 [Phytophthora rubi]
MSELEWHVLHTLLYTVSAWAGTLLGRVPEGARATWYATFPLVRELCHGIVADGNWSSATLAPTGQLWRNADDNNAPTSSSY